MAQLDQAFWKRLDSLVEMPFLMLILPKGCGYRYLDLAIAHLQQAIAPKIMTSEIKLRSRCNEAIALDGISKIEQATDHILHENRPRTRSQCPLLIARQHDNLC
jgi:hypothetical protein